MSERKQEDFEAAIRNTFSAIRALPTFQGDVTVGLTSDVILNDSAVTNGFGVRRFEITNTSETDGYQLGIKILLAGETATGHDITDCKKILKGQTWCVNVGSNMRLAAVASPGAIVANLLVEDFI